MNKRILIILTERSELSPRSRTETNHRAFDEKFKRNNEVR